MPHNYVIEDESAKDLTPDKHFDRKMRLDKRGYFLIRINRSAKEISVAFCEYNNRIKYRIASSEPKDIIKTVIQKGLLSMPEHAAYLGRELEKASTAIKMNMEYVQDEALSPKKKKGRTIAPMLFYARRIPKDITSLLQGNVRYDRLSFSKKNLSDIQKISSQHKKPILVHGYKVVVGWKSIRLYLKEIF